MTCDTYCIRASSSYENGVLEAGENSQNFAEFPLGIAHASDWTRSDDTNMFSTNILSSREVKFLKLDQTRGFKIQIKTDLILRFQADDSVNPSVINAIYLDTGNEVAFQINDGRDHTSMSLVQTKDRLICQAVPGRTNVSINTLHFIDNKGIDI